MPDDEYVSPMPCQSTTGGAPPKGFAAKGTFNSSNPNPPESREPETNHEDESKHTRHKPQAQALKRTQSGAMPMTNLRCAERRQNRGKEFKVKAFHVERTGRGGRGENPQKTKTKPLPEPRTPNTNLPGRTSID